MTRKEDLFSYGVAKRIVDEYFGKIKLPEATKEARIKEMERELERLRRQSNILPHEERLHAQQLEIVAKELYCMKNDLNPAVYERSKIAHRDCRLEEGEIATPRFVRNNENGTFRQDPKSVIVSGPLPTRE